MYVDKYFGVSDMLKCVMQVESEIIQKEEINLVPLISSQPRP